MPAIKLVTSEDIGKGLQENAGKLNVKVDGLTVLFNDNDELTAVQSVDIKLSAVELLPDNMLQFTLSDGTVVSQSLSELINVDTNTYASSAKFTATALVITLNDGNTVSAPLSDVLPTIQQISKDVVDDFRGNEATDLAGNSLGYFMVAPTAP